MIHRKSQSYSESVGSVPFSWEEKPGISKFSPGCQNKTAGPRIQPPLQKSLSSHFQSPLNMMGCYADNYDMKISPPPRMTQPPGRSPSTKGLWGRRQDDPFAAAIKECTKNVTSLGDPSRIKKYIGSIKNRNQSIILSCKGSCDVKEGNLVRLVDLPPLPRGRNGRCQAR